MRPRKARRAWPVRAAAWLLAATCAACGSGQAPPSAGTPAPTQAASARPSSAPPSPTESAAPTAPVSPSASPGQPIRFVSELYPYALTMPAGSLTLNWHAASTPWDEAQRFDLLGPAVDRSSVADGGLLLVGGPAPDGLKAFSALGVAKANVHHTCTPLNDEHRVTIGKVPAIVLSQSCAGQVLGRATLVRDGQGLIAFVWVNSGYEGVALDHLVTWLDAGLEWTGP